jgi:hypothetical protein
MINVRAWLESLNKLIDKDRSILDMEMINLVDDDFDMYERVTSLPKVMNMDVKICSNGEKEIVAFNAEDRAVFPCECGGGIDRALCINPKK